MLQTIIRGSSTRSFDQDIDRFVEPSLNSLIIERVEWAQQAPIASLRYPMAKEDGRKFNAKICVVTRIWQRDVDGCLTIQGEPRMMKWCLALRCSEAFDVVSELWVVACCVIPRIREALLRLTEPKALRSIDTE